MSPKHYVLIAVIGAIVLGLWRLYVHADGVGYTRAMGEVAARDNERLVKAQARIRELEKDKSDLEARHAAEIEAIDHEGLEELRRVTSAKDRFVSDVVAGRIRLFDPGHKPCPGGGGSPPAEAPATASVDHGASAGGLSVEASRFLLEEAGRANTVAVQLRACQNVVLSDRGRPLLPSLGER